jgi:hypothetical protein
VLSKKYLCGAAEFFYLMGIESKTIQILLDRQISVSTAEMPTNHQCMTQQ